MRQLYAWYAYVAKVNPPNDWLKRGWARDSQTRTRLVDSLFCITCSLENNAYSILRFTTLSDSFCPRFREAARWHYCN